jgi:hypothetical protein
MEQLHKVSLTLPASMRLSIEEERRAMSQRIGADLSFNQIAQALFRKALEQQDTRPTA